MGKLGGCLALIGCCPKLEGGCLAFIGPGGRFEEASWLSKSSKFAVVCSSSALNVVGCGSLVSALCGKADCCWRGLVMCCCSSSCAFK
jgi:hypothetical protein